MIMSRYISLTENKYIRYFGGHTKRVVTLCMNPTDETFLSGTLNNISIVSKIFYIESPNKHGDSELYLHAPPSYRLYVF